MREPHRRERLRAAPPRRGPAPRAARSRPRCPRAGHWRRRLWSTKCSQPAAMFAAFTTSIQLVVEAVDDAVVHERPLRREDARSTDAARLERADVVAGDALHERVAVGAGDLELAHVRDVEQPDASRTARCSARDPAADTAPASRSRRTERASRRGTGRAIAVVERRCVSRVCSVDQARLPSRSPSAHQRGHAMPSARAAGSRPRPTPATAAPRSPRRTLPRRGAPAGSGGRWRRGRRAASAPRPRCSP